MAYGTEEWPTLKSYRPLNRAAKQIRLLSLHPSGNDSMIPFNLAHHSLSQHQQHHGVEYYALSYVWGEASSMQIVEVNGERVEIRSTLWHFLYSLRKILQDVSDAGVSFKALNGKPVDRILLWIDFLCINQTDIDERNSQAFEFLLNHAAIFEAEDPIDASSADRVDAIVKALGTLATSRQGGGRFNIAARAVELNTPFTGIITQCELCAIVEKANDIPFHRHRSAATDRSQQRRVYIYKREIEVLNADTEGGSVTYVDLAFSTAEIQPGDHVFSIYERGGRGPQLVLREHPDGLVLRSIAISRLRRAGTLDQWRSWLTLGNVDDPRAWADQCCWGAQFQLSNAHEVAELLRAARSQPDAVLLKLKDVNIKVVYNEAALMEVLRNSSGLYDGDREGVWCCREARHRPLRESNSTAQQDHTWSMEVY